MTESDRTPHHPPATDTGLVESLDVLHASLCEGQRRLFELIAEADRRATWVGSGARDLAHWLSIRYGISLWKAHRWIGAAHALEGLPRLAEALRTGTLGVDKVVELARFATRESESDLVAWARGVSPACVRRKADLAARQAIAEIQEAQRARFLEWWHVDDGRRIGLEAELPAAEGAVVVRAIERLAERVPVMPGEEDADRAAARRADALVTLCSGAVAGDPDPDRATIVVHAQLDALASRTRGSAIEGGGVAHPETVRRLLCSARVQAVLEDERGDVVGLGRLTREPSAWMVRQLRYRDAGCRFPGCGARRFTHAHHIVWWERGGRTDLDNLLLVCAFHHKLVHELGWRVRREPDGTVTWFRPDGARYRAGPAPPTGALGTQPVLATTR